MSRTMVNGQLLSDAGVEKFARLWVNNLFHVYGNPATFHRDGKSGRNLFDAWAEFPWRREDYIAVIMFIAQDEELRWKLHCWDVLYMEGRRVVEWDPETSERFSYTYSLERNITRLACGYANFRPESLAALNYWADYDAREDKRYG